MSKKISSSTERLARELIEFLKKETYITYQDVETLFDYTLCVLKNSKLF
jgi:hypothetical protein